MNKRIMHHYRDNRKTEKLKYNPTINDFKLGEVAARDETRHPDFDLMAAICSFDGDPADTSFQRGYLDALLSIHEAEVKS